MENYVPLFPPSFLPKERLSFFLGLGLILIFFATYTYCTAGGDLSASVQMVILYVSDIALVYVL